MRSIVRFFKKPFFSDYRTTSVLWLVLAITGVVLKFLKGPGSYNNYLIFKNVYWHAVDGVSLYGHYPELYFDKNHYGPFFSLIIAPFAVLPDFWGVLLWVTGNVMLLYWAVKQLPLERWQHALIYWLTVNEVFASVVNQQLNLGIAAILILSYTLIRDKRDFWAAFLIMAGTFVKLYGIVGLAFFFFSKQKKHFILYCIFWAVVMLVLPMLFFGTDYILQQYAGWYESLQIKNGENMFSPMQNISFLGMVRKISGNAAYSDLWLIVPGLVLFFLPYLRISRYGDKRFQMLLLSSVLLFTVLFSTGSESSTYIIPFTGVIIWFLVTPERHGWKYSNLALLLFALIFTGFSSSDLFPRFIRMEYIRPYALKALPCMIVWLFVIYDMCKGKFVSNYRNK